MKYQWPEPCARKFEISPSAQTEPKRFSSSERIEAVNCETVSGNTKLARRPKLPNEMRDEHDRVKTLIETKGEGGFIIIAPSNGRVHPSNGRYELVSGGLAAIATITPEERDDLLSLARTFDQMPNAPIPAVEAA